MRRAILAGLAAALATLLPAEGSAQQRSQLGPLCTSENTPADKQIDACNKIIALKVFSGEKLADVYFWRAVGWNKKGDYTKVIADATEAIRLNPKAVGLYNLRGSAYYDKGEFDIAIADFNDALRLGGPHSTIFHNRGNAWRNKGDHARALTDYNEAVRLDPRGAFSYQNRGIVKLALGDLDGALSDLNEAIRLSPSLASTYTNRGVLWRAKGENDRAIADTNEAIRLLRHGVQIDGRNYLVPVDVKLQGGINPAETMTDMDTLVAGLDDQVRTNILIFDACRNNPMAQQTASAASSRAIAVVSGLAAPSAPASGATRGAGTLIAFATAPGQVALDGEGANSPFSAALSRHVGTPGLEVQQMLTRVRAEVVASTKGQQVPWSNSSLLGEVFLAAKP